MHQPAGAGSIDSGCEGRLPWLDRSQHGLPCTKEGMKAYFSFLIFLKMSISASPALATSTPAAPGGVGCAAGLLWRTWGWAGLCACGQRPPVLLKKQWANGFGNEQWTEEGVSGQCETWTGWTGIERALNLVRNIVRRIGHSDLHEVVLQIPGSRHGAIHSGSCLQQLKVDEGSEVSGTTLFPPLSRDVS